MSILSNVRFSTKILRQFYCINQNSKFFPKENISVYSIRCFSAKKATHKPNTLEKYLLVWMKKFPSVAEVPKTVSSDTMEKTRNWARIKINIIFCIITGFICVYMVYSGKQAAKRGESIQKMNLKWHDEQNAKKD